MRADNKRLLSTLLFAVACLVTGCAREQAQGIFGGGRPTTVECEGKGMVSAGPCAFQADCGERFKFKINIQ